MGTAWIAGVEFEVVRRGLHPDEVAAALSQALRERDDLRTRVQSLDALVAEAQAALNAAREQAETPHSVGEAEAAEIRAAASADAGAIMQQALQVRLDADQQAKEIRARAEAEVAPLLAEAKRALAAAEVARAEAEREAEAIRASARRDAEQMRGAAEVEVQDLRDSARRESAVDAARLTSEAQAHLGGLYRDLTVHLTTLADEARVVSGSGNHADATGPSTRAELPPAPRQAEPVQMPRSSPRIAALVGDAPDDTPRYAPAAIQPQGEHSPHVAAETGAETAHRPVVSTAAVRSRAAAIPVPHAPLLPKRPPSQTGPIVVRTLDSVLQPARDAAEPS